MVGRSWVHLLVPFRKNMGAIATRMVLKWWPRALLEETIIELIENREQRDWFGEYLIQERRAERFQTLLAHDVDLTDKDFGRAAHMADLEIKNARLKDEVRTMQVAAEKHNRRNYATGLIVNCTGCDRGGPANFEGLTEERVQEVERIAARLRTWWTNHQSRK